MANDDPKPATDPGTRGSTLRKQRIEAAKEAARQRWRELGLPELAEDEQEWLRRRYAAER